MKKLWLLAFAFVFVIFGSACETSTTSTTTTTEDGDTHTTVTKTETANGYTTYEHEDFEFTFLEDWTMEEDVYGTVVSVLSPLDDDADIFSENCNVVIDDAAEDYTVEEYLAASVETLEAYITDYSPSEEGTIEMGGEDGFYINYDGVQGEYGLTWIQYIVKPYDVFYILTCTSSVETFDDYEADFDDVASSFSVR